MITVNSMAIKEAISKCGKCAKNDKTAPLTQLLNIKTVDSHTLKFTSTDEFNTFSYYLVDTSSEFEIINVCVLIEQLSKLINKFNSATISLTISETGNEIIVEGDGKYKLPIPIDSDGKAIAYPEIETGETISEVYSGSISKILASAKYCEGSIMKLTPDIQAEDYPRTNYFVGKDIIALDGFLVTNVSGDFMPFNTLISPTTLKLLSMFSDEDFVAYKTSTYTVFKCSNCVLYTVEPDGLDVFPVESVYSLIDGITGNIINISANVIVNALNRLTLFTDERQDNSIRIVFNNSGVFAYTLDGACVEQLSSEKCESFECYINAISFLALLKAYGTDVIKLHYGDEQCFKVEFENVHQLIVLSEYNGN